MRAALTFTCVLLFSLTLLACHPANDTAVGAAASFLDDHYVRIDLDAALQHCVGLAREKVAEEKRLVGDQKIDETTRQPRVTYRLKEERPEAEDHVSLVFDAMIHVDGTDSFARRWLVTVRRMGNEWKVSNFSDFE